MHIAAQQALSSLQPRRASGERKRTRVSLITLDQPIERFGVPRFCKIDGEGFELEVLKGLSRPIPMLTLEFHLTGDNVAQTIACVDRLGEMSPLSINVSLEGGAELVCEQWIDDRQFRSDFPAAISRVSTSVYGDLFIRMLTSEGR